MKNKLILDTTWWYSRTDLLKLAEDHDIVGTTQNLHELITTPNIINKPLLFRSAIINILNIPKLYFKSDPIQHICHLVNPSFYPDNSLFKELHLQAELIASMSKADLLLVAKEERLNIQRDIDKYDSPLESFVLFVNEIIPTLKDNIKKSTGSKDHMKSDSLYIVKQFIISFIERNLSNNYINLDWVKFNWSKIELLINVWDLFNKNLETGRISNFTTNDIYDLFHLSYVQPGNYYSTAEKKWQQIILSNAITAKYLISL